MHPFQVGAFRITAVGAAVLALAAPLASAHERDFTLSRDWHLPYKGENEIESRTFWKTKPNDLLQEFEYEYGVTDHFALEPGLELKKPNGEAFKLEGAELELRFNFFEFGYDKILPALNLEYERRIKAGGEEEDEEEEDEKDSSSS